MGGATVSNSLNKMSIANRKLAREYLDERSARGLSENTLRSYAGGLLKADRMNRKPFAQWTKGDCVSFLNSIENRNTRNATGILLKTFLRSIGKEKVVDWWKPKQTFGVLPDSVPTDAEVMAFLKAIPGTEYRSFFHVLFDSGARVASILGLRVHQVAFDGYGAVVTLPSSKGGMGLRLRLVSSVPILREWLNNHPTPPDGRVWQISYDRANRRFHAAVQKAGIKKSLTIHDLRHARATQMARAGMSESLMRKHFGWRPGSRMTERYTHLSGGDLEAAVLKANGIEMPASNPAVGLKTIPCPACETANDATYSFCSNCNMSLTSASSSVDGLIGVLNRVLDASELDEELADIRRVKDSGPPGSIVVGGDLFAREKRIHETLAALYDLSRKIATGLVALKQGTEQLDALAAEKEASPFVEKSDAEIAEWAKTELRDIMMGEVKNRRRSP